MGSKNGNVQREWQTHVCCPHHTLPLFHTRIPRTRDVNKMGVQFLVGVGGRGGVWANVTQ